MKNKKQHVIPACYLKAWCDPTTPAGQTPYIWRISKDGSTKKKKSPDKSFTETDRYTIRLPNGDRDLTVEHTLAGLENQFVQVLKRIRRREKLSVWDKARLCMFTAAMHSRTKAMGAHWKEFWEKVHGQVVAGERKHNAKPITSLETAEIVERANQDLVMVALQEQTPLYFAMGMSILVTNDDDGFITSDAPCTWVNPKAHTFPPGLRYPALGQPEIEVSLPLTPQHLLLISHVRYPLYTDVPQSSVDNANGIRLDFCTEEFVSWKGSIRPDWFKVPEQQTDAWENTPEGKKSMAQHEEDLKHQREWEAEQKAKSDKQTPNQENNSDTTVP